MCGSIVLNIVLGSSKQRSRFYFIFSCSLCFSRFVLLLIAFVAVMHCNVHKLRKKSRIEERVTQEIRFYGN